jgi:uncharacterized protein (TIGR00369 family)
MDIKTHQQIEPRLCGQPVEISRNGSRVTLTTTEEMAVDGYQLVHGGFVFGLADYAAMLAVNHPNVVLAAADVKFLKPVRVGDVVTAEANVEKAEGKKHSVKVNVYRDAEPVFEGSFTCFILTAHVLESVNP